ncbi:MAG: hypothetical protein METHAR1v1_310011 [Methanothrix sp.]|nr:MAG: hypothetical protein METHAR1v1_310011 [Methanothrix sp.]
MISLSKIKWATERRQLRRLGLISAIILDEGSRYGFHAQQLVIDKLPHAPTIFMRNKRERKSNFRTH